MRDPYRPLGEVRIGGSVVEHERVPEPWGERRACVHVDGAVRLASQPAPESRPVVTALLFEGR